MRSDLSIRILFNYFINVFRECYKLRVPELKLLLMLLFDHHLFIMFLLQFLFFFNDDLSFENDLYIIKYVMIVNMIMNRIILRGSVENNNNQPYPANDLTIIIPTFVFRSCYYSLMKPIQSFVPHYSTLVLVSISALARLSPSMGPRAQR